jgi:quercetin dioxygenase-like cupin family protein
MKCRRPLDGEAKGRAVAGAACADGFFIAKNGRGPQAPDRQEESSMVKEETDRQIENKRTRVTRHRMAPGASTGFHRHDYDYVIVPVTDGRMRIVEGGGETIAELKAGVAYFRPAGVEHDVFNGGDRELIFVEVELVS